MDTIPPAYWTKVYFGGSSCGTRRFLLLIGVTLLGLAPVACARVPSHFAVPQLAVADAAFIPTPRGVYPDPHLPLFFRSSRSAVRDLGPIAFAGTQDRVMTRGDSA